MIRTTLQRRHAFFLFFTSMSFLSAPFLSPCLSFPFVTLRFIWDSFLSSALYFLKGEYTQDREATLGLSFPIVCHIEFSVFPLCALPLLSSTLRSPLAFPLLSFPSPFRPPAYYSGKADVGRFPFSLHIFPAGNFYTII